MSDLSESVFLDALDDLFVGFDERGTAAVWNRAVEDVTGYSDAELARMTALDFFDEADADRVRDAVAESFETGESVVEAELVTADGERLPYEFTLRRLPDDAPVASVGIARDVTERKRQRERMRTRERVIREMYEIIADRERSFDEKVEALLALGRAELDTAYGSLSKIEGDDYVFEIVDAEDESIRPGDVVPLSATNCEVAASRQQTLVLGDVAQDAPEQTDRAGYTEWGISCYIGAPVFVDGEVYGTFCFYDTEPRSDQFLDWEVTLVDLMSRWVSYELQREQTNERLQQQNERLEKFASMVSHDLRNPLNIAEGSLDLAEETGDAEQFSRARGALERMDTLIDDLLTLARSGAVIGDREEIDLASVCHHSWENVPTGDATLVVETDRTVRAARTALQQLLENLFSNAVEHGSIDGRRPADDVEHGTTGRQRSADDAAEHGSDRRDTADGAAERGGRGVAVRVGELDDGFYVEDDGPGIPVDDRQTVFERGYSTTREGTGFGLAIVAEIADTHGWDVTVTDGADGGARFEFTGLSE